jgi:hypothetical protein
MGDDSFTFDELERHNRFVKYERENVIPILIDWSYTKENCFTILKNAKIFIEAGGSAVWKMVKFDQSILKGDYDEDNYTLYPFNYTK